MSEVITIGITSDELSRRAERVARARSFQPVDRVPVLPGLYVRYWLPRIGVSFGEYFSDPEAMLRAQIHGQKWLLENVESDLVFNPIAPDFQNVREAGSLGCEIVAPADDLIWVHEGWVRTEADLRELRQIDPLATGLQRRTIEFARRMRELADRYVVRLKDGAEIRPGATAQLPAGTMGPFTVAGQLAGVTELLVALYERPEFARELLAIVTDKIIDWMAYCEQTQGMGVLGIADDYAGNLSARHFREFVLPCLRRIRSHFPGAWFRFHMCGKVDHLVPVLADELRIQEFGLFGFELDKRRVQAVMGGRVVLVGNVAPMNVYGGTPDSVLDESLEALHVFGQGSGGFILTDGANIPPGSPVENVNAMWRAARQVVREAAPSPPARRS